MMVEPVLSTAEGSRKIARSWKPRRAMLRVATLAASAMGGAGMYLLLGWTVDWRLGGMPAQLTARGYRDMAIIGAVLGLPWAVALRFSMLNFFWRARDSWMFALLGGMIVGAVGSRLLIPFHLPVELVVSP